MQMPAYSVQWTDEHNYTTNQENASSDKMSSGSPDSACSAENTLPPSGTSSADGLHPGLDDNLRNVVDHHPASSSASIKNLVSPIEANHDRRAIEGLKLSKFLKGKEREWAAVAEKTGPLELLDLPVDVLREILKEVTHTNDLTSLALTHSALHNLAIPYIYSRFDIVWPDAHNTAEPRTGVDALTYGLATLVMGEEIFSPLTAIDRRSAEESGKFYKCDHCGTLNNIDTSREDQLVKRIRRRRGNYFSRYTRKFSLGNGPPDWVQEYLITKEGGKMLGTLVALAVARMPNLETFVWDMPTGVLRDVWSALSSLGDRLDGRESRLERLWIRWHDNSEVLPPPPPQQPIPIPQSTAPPAPSMVANAIPLQLGIHQSSTPSNAPPLPSVLQISYANTECPNFSTLSPLKSLTVLDIDEPAYLEEMSVLIERSSDRLRELRIGIAPTVSKRGWSSLAPGSAQGHGQDDPRMEFLGWGGVLGLIMSKIYDCRVQKQAFSAIVREAPASPKPPGAQQDTEVPTMSAPLFSAPIIETSPSNLTVSSKMSNDGPMTSAVENAAPDYDVREYETVTTLSESYALPGSPDALPLPQPCSEAVDSAQDISAGGKPLTSHNGSAEATEYQLKSPAPYSSSLAGELPISNPSMKSINIVQDLKSFGQTARPESVNLSRRSSPINQAKRCTQLSSQKRLRLEVLELERMSLTVSVLQKTLDWSFMTSLTLLGCGEHEQLWKTLRRTYAPRSNVSLTQINAQSISKRASQPRLRHTSTSDSMSISPSDYRLSLKRIHTDTVSPSLISFLKEGLAPNSLEWMFLQEGRPYGSTVTVDAIYKGPLRRHRASLKKVMIDSSDRDQDGRSNNQKWRKWMLSRDVLTFITSGKMSGLRELAMVVDYKDWHFFLQRLPQIPHLRSLNVPHIADHVYAHHLDARELALQVVDIVALRPDIEICYMGINNKCFEILENRNHDDSAFLYHDSTTSPANAGPGGVVIGNPDDDSDADDDDHDDEDDDDNDDDDDDADAADSAPATVDMDETDSDAADDSEGATDDEAEGIAEGRRRPKLRLREILFYDDKVSIFKARHGRL